MATLTATTPRLILADFKTQILAISPSHPDHKDQTWAYVPNRGAVEKAHRLRLFTFEALVAHERGRMVHGDGRDYEFELRIWTAYGALAEDDDDSIITEDAIQIAGALEARFEPVVAGLISVFRNSDPWIEGEESQPGKRYGAHVFDVAFWATHPT